MLDATDRQILRVAADASRVIVSKDEDFALLVTIAPSQVQVVWLRIGNANNAQLIAWLEPVLAKIVDRLDAGERLVEVR